MVQSESQGDVYYIPIHPSKLTNMGLFKVDCNDEFEHFDSKFLLPRKTAFIVQLPGWTQWARDAYCGSKIIPESIELVLYQPEENQFKINSAFEFYGIYEHGHNNCPTIHLLFASEYSGLLAPHAHLEDVSDVRKGLVRYISGFLKCELAFGEFILLWLVSHMYNK